MALDKNERDNLANEIISGEGIRINDELYFHIDKITECIDRFVGNPEPRPHIRVGDIYKDNQGNVQTIVEVDYDSYFPLMTQERRTYTLNGRLDSGDADRSYDLDLSRRFQLVEVKTEEAFR